MDINVKETLIDNIKRKHFSSLGTALLNGNFDEAFKAAVGEAISDGVSHGLHLASQEKPKMPSHDVVLIALQTLPFGYAVLPYDERVSLQATDLLFDTAERLWRIPREWEVGLVGNAVQNERYVFALARPLMLIEDGLPVMTDVALHGELAQPNFRRIADGRLTKTDWCQRERGDNDMIYAGDKYWFPREGRWTDVKESDIGRKVNTYLCVIRPKEFPDMSDVWSASSVGSFRDIVRRRLQAAGLYKWLVLDSGPVSGTDKIWMQSSRCWKSIDETEFKGKDKAAHDFICVIRNFVNA